MWNWRNRPALTRILQAVVIEPGDKLIVRLASDARPEVAAALTNRLRELMPDLETAVIAAEEIAVVKARGKGAE